MAGKLIPSRDGLESLLVRGLSALPPRASRCSAARGRFASTVSSWSPEIQLTLRLLKLSGRSAFEELPVAEARAEIRREAALYSGATIPIAAVDEVEVAGAAGPMPARLYSPARGSLSRATAGLPARRRVGRRRPRHTRPAMPLPRAARRRAGAVGGLPARAGASVPRRRGGLGRRGPARDRGAARFGADPARVAVGGDSAGGNLAAAAARLLTIGGGPVPAFQLLIYPVTDLTRKRESYRLFSEGFFLTARQMDWYRDHYLPSESGCERSAGVAGSRREPGRVAARARRHRRVRRAARRGRGLRGPAARCRGEVTATREPGLIHGFTHGAETGRAPRAAMLRVAEALAAGLAAAPKAAPAQRSRS